MDWFILTGDDDQTIFSFSGASPDAFLNPPVPDKDKIILDRSWRVPRAVHGAAMEMILRVSRREPKEYAPKDEAGAVKKLDCHYKHPDKAVEYAIQRSRRAKRS